MNELIYIVYDKFNNLSGSNFYNLIIAFFLLKLNFN